ncbi:MAG: hypothetical protein COB53_02750 [Elusimicrobia bacterium]|nr:MAG: hypothetical protein COB53_02750 [Elusimicrobiota bacterium]
MFFSARRPKLPGGKQTAVMSADEGEFTGSGGFRIDASRALEKLAAFQLKDPNSFLLPWLRAVNTSSATRIDVRKTSYTVEVVSDGLPLSRDFLRFPFQEIFSTKDDADRRHIDAATALLTAYRLHPKLIEIISGSGQERMRLSASALGKEDVAPYSDGKSTTTLRVTWNWLQAANTGSPLRIASDSCRMMRTPIYFEGRGLKKPGEDVFPFHPFESPQCSGILRPIDPYGYHPHDRFDDSTLEVHRSGVAVFVEEGASPGSVQWTFPDAIISGDIDAERFGLNASQSAVLNDEHLKEVMAAVGREIPELILKAAAAHAQYPEMSAFLFTPGAKKFLEYCLDDQPGQLKYINRDLNWIGGSRELFHQWLDWEVNVAVWLRDSASRIFAGGKTPGDSPWRQALWTAPLYLSATGHGISLEHIAARTEKETEIGINTFDPSSALSEGELWAPFGPDRFLDKIFTKTQFTRLFWP